MLHIYIYIHMHISMYAYTTSSIWSSCRPFKTFGFSFPWAEPMFQADLRQSFAGENLARVTPPHHLEN